MSTPTHVTRKRRADGVTQRYHTKPDIAPSEVSAGDVIAERAARRAAGVAALHRIAYTNASDSMRADIIGEMTGAIGETPAETRARELRERREHRGVSPVEITFGDSWLELYRRSPSYGGTNFYDSVESAVREATGITHPTSTGHDDWVYFWDIPVGRAKAEAFRDAMHARGWTRAEIKEDKP